jgi:hypothetical protein
MYTRHGAGSEYPPNAVLFSLLLSGASVVQTMPQRQQPLRAVWLQPRASFADHREHWKYVNCPASTVFAAERLAVNFCKDGVPDGELLAMEPTAT